jgi:hypothetical protein
VIDRGDPEPRVVTEPELADAAEPAAPVAPPPGSVRPFPEPARMGAPVIAAPQPPAPPPAPLPQAVKAPAPEAAPARREASRVASRPPPPPPDPLPAFRVERTTWHPLAERRLAVVDVPGQGVRELREGDEVDGATVSRIEPSGVVFRYQGREVRRKVGTR